MEQILNSRHKLTVPFVLKEGIVLKQVYLNQMVFVILDLLVVLEVLPQLLLQEGDYKQLVEFVQQEDIVNKDLSMLQDDQKEHIIQLKGKMRHLIV